MNVSGKNDYRKLTGGRVVNSLLFVEIVSVKWLLYMCTC